MKHKHFILLVAALFVAIQMPAQKRARKAVKPKVETPDTAQIVKNYIDSLTVLRQQLDSLQEVNSLLRQESNDGRYFRLFVPTTFYHSGANKTLSLSPNTGDEVTDAVDAAMMSLYMRRPDLVSNNETRLKEVGTIREDVNKDLTQQVELTDMATPTPEEPEAMPVQLVVQKPHFWKFKGDGYLQFLQNHVSDNWYKGGESNYSAVGAATLEMNFNNRDRLTWDNKLEMKLGIQTSPSDTVNKFKTNNDLLRLTSKLGMQAHNHWYYTLQMLAYTQFARGLKANDKKVYSDFLSPFDLNLGIGMEYKVEWLNKRLTGTLNFLPFSFNFRYVDRWDLRAANGITTDHHTMEDFGSQMTAELKWNIADPLTWKTRLFAYTSYHRALIEWENQFELKVTKYISANLFLYPRFDDSTVPSEEHGYWQFQEWSSIGLTYTW